MSWYDHVLMNRSPPTSNPAVNIADGLQRYVRPKREKNSPQIRINKGSATNPIDEIM